MRGLRILRFFLRQLDDRAAVLDVAAHGASQVDRVAALGGSIAAALACRQASRHDQDRARDLGHLVGHERAEVAPGQDLDGRVQRHVDAFLVLVAARRPRPSAAAAAPGPRASGSWLATPSSPRSSMRSGMRERQNSSNVASWSGMSSGLAVSTDRSAVLNSCRSERSTASAVRSASMTSDGVTSISRSRSSRQKSMMLRCRSLCFARLGIV